MYAAYRCATPAAPVYRARYDVAETAEAFELTIDLPGVDSADVDVKLEDGRLSVTATRWLGPAVGEGGTRPSRKISQSFTVPDTVDPVKVAARLDKGVLNLTLGKRDGITPRSVKVEVH